MLRRLLVMWLLFFVLYGSAQGQQDLVTPPMWVARLDEKIDVDIVDQSLDDALAALAHEMGVEVAYHRRELTDMGLSLEELAHAKATLKARGVSRRVVFEQLLRPWDLAVDEAHETFRITSLEHVKSLRLTRIYDVDALIATIGEDSRRRGVNATISEFAAAASELNSDPFPEHPGACRALIGFLKSSVWLDTWEDNGGDGRLSFDDGRLVIEQSAGIHREVGAFLARTADMLANRRQVIHVAPPPAWVAKLDEKIDVEIVDQSLNKALDQIVAPTGVSVRFDFAGLAEVGISAEQLSQTKATLRGRAITRRAALRQLLDPLEDATYLTDNMGLLVTIPGCPRLSTRLYDIDSLIRLLGEDRRRRGVKPLVAKPSGESAPKHSPPLEPYPEHPGAYEELRNFLKETVESNAWEEDPCDMACFFGGYLVIRQYDYEHRQVEAALSRLRENLEKGAAAKGR